MKKKMIIIKVGNLTLKGDSASEQEQLSRGNSTFKKPWKFWDLTFKLSLKCGSPLKALLWRRGSTEFHVTHCYHPTDASICQSLWLSIDTHPSIWHSSFNEYVHRHCVSLVFSSADISSPFWYTYVYRISTWFPASSLVKFDLARWPISDRYFLVTWLDVVLARASRLGFHVSRWRCNHNFFFILLFTYDARTTGLLTWSVSLFLVVVCLSVCLSVWLLDCMTGWLTDWMSD